MAFKLPRRTLIATAAGALVAGGARAEDAKPIRIGMTVSSTGTFALAAQSPGLWLLAGSAIAVCLLFFPQERFRIPVIDPTLIVCAGLFAADRS